MWIGQQRVGETPLDVAVPATGPLEDHTYEPAYATFRHRGYRDEVRPFRYAWSIRNVLLSIPTLMTTFWFLALLPRDMHVRLLAEE